VGDADEQAWWYRRDDSGGPGGAPEPASTGGAPSLPTPDRNRPFAPDPDHDTPHPGRAAPGRHGWARSEGTYTPSVSDRGATKSIVLGIIGLLICGFLFGPAAIVEGIHARRRIAASGGGLTGNARAIVGICLGGTATFLSALSALAIVVRAMTV